MTRRWQWAAIATSIVAASVLWGVLTLKDREEIALNERSALPPPANCPRETAELAKEYRDQCDAPRYACGDPLPPGVNCPSPYYACLSGPKFSGPLKPCPPGVEMDLTEHLTTVHCRCSPAHRRADGSTANSDFSHKEHEKWPGEDRYVPRENNHLVSISGPNRWE